MAVFTRIKTWVSNEVLTAVDLNTEFNNIIANMDPDGIEDYSNDVANMQSTADPGGVGTESLATTLAGEVQRLRFVVKRIVGGAQWYVAPLFNLGSQIATSSIADDAITTDKIADEAVTSAKIESSARQIKKMIYPADGSYTFTTPATAPLGTMYKITCVGPGGGGAMWNAGSGGGGSGGTSVTWIDTLPPSTGYAVIVGAGGLGGQINTQSGASGSGPTSFSSICIANEGAGGVGNGSYYRGGIGGVVGTGDIACGGGAGTGNGGVGQQAGAGGNSSLGGGGYGAQPAAGLNSGGNGLANGSGGGGGWSSVGGSGGNGLCMIEWVE